MFNLFKVIGAFSFALILMTMIAAPKKPEKQLTTEQTKAKQVREYCIDLVMRGVTVKGSATVPSTRNFPLPMDNGGNRWSYTDIIRGGDAYGMTLESLFRCKVQFVNGDQLNATYLKVGDVVAIGG